MVLPELISSGYMFESAAEAASVAIGTDHPLIAGWIDAAARADIVLAAGFCERGDDGLTYNSAALIDASGLRAVYRKLHLWDREKLWFAPGTELPPVVDTRVGRVSVVICYDLEFPELTRTVALDGTQLLLVPTNWPLMPRPDGERPAEAGIAMATARMNRMAVACADRFGTERGQAWTGGTTIVDADGWAVAETRESGDDHRRRRSRGGAGQALHPAGRCARRPASRALRRGQPLGRLLGPGLHELKQQPRPRRDAHAAPGDHGEEVMKRL